MTQDADPAQRFRNIAAAYTDSIRVTDFKANVALVFVAIMLGPVVGARDKFPPFLPLPLVLVPVLTIFLCLLICLYPRYPREGRQHFLISPRARAADFSSLGDTGDEMDELSLRCAILSRILYWKTFFLKISLALCMLAVLAGALLVLFMHFRPA
ncbi:MAG: hypothetical protein ABR970_00920 [Roseiarcus sp.]|jgi:hypothetical protein